MQKHPLRLPIILILITLLSAADWAVAGASTRMSAWRPGGTRGFGGATTFSGEPDQPAIRSGTPGSGASGGNSKRLLISDATYEAAGFWIRMFEVRYFGR